MTSCSKENSSKSFPQQILDILMTFEQAKIDEEN
jgi:hypothetical protein